MQGGERVSGDLGRDSADEEEGDGGARESPDRGPEVLVPNGLPEVVMNKRSYATVVGNSSWPTIDSLPDPIQARNFQRIVIPQQDYESKRQNFRFALIGRVNFCLISLDALREEASVNWKLSKGMTMHPLGKGFVIFQFQCEGDKSAVWRRSPLRVGDQVIRFQHWKPDFNIHEKQTFTKLVWIRLSDPPLEYWHENVLLSIAKAVGRPVALDRRTREGLLGYFAKVLVEIDISESAVRIDEVQVERLELGTAKVFGFRQKVVYEDNVERCGYCRRLGHQVSFCRLKKAEDAKQSAKDNATLVPGAVFVEDGVNPKRVNSVVELPSLSGDFINANQDNPNLGNHHDLVGGGNLQIILEAPLITPNEVGKEAVTIVTEENLDSKFSRERSPRSVG
ncbi:uncharacterized protein LOC122086773 [Macadamia integrifolia]|uniref:uncharacterized protein LOC122086773 n=1 Tax=Macadamia integrifolia TaxID=60698 RepID=UPI001C4EC314|nr:uncharacterized protein LOC122086773 [Macadamia integrifolia]